MDDLRYTAVPARAEQLTTLRHAVIGWAQRAGMQPAQLDAVVLATYEALANVVMHAYPDGTGTLDLHAAYEPRTARVQVTVTDRGRWRPGGSHTLGGRGLVLIRQLADTVEVRPGVEGTTVRLCWTVPPPFTGKPA